MLTCKFIVGVIHGAIGFIKYLVWGIEIAGDVPKTALNAKYKANNIDLQGVIQTVKACVESVDVTIHIVFYTVRVRQLPKVTNTYILICSQLAKVTNTYILIL